MDLSQLSTADLLVLYGQIENLLRKRDVTRTCNNPVGDLAEKLFKEAFHWELGANSKAHVDAIDPADGSRYQIKARRLTEEKKPRQLSAIRGLHEANFNFLAAVLFDENYRVRRAAIIPYSIVKELAKPDKHTNSSKFFLRENVWDIPGVRDVTNQLRSVVL